MFTPRIGKSKYHFTQKHSLLLVPGQILDSQAINYDLLLSEAWRQWATCSTYSMSSYIPNIILVKLGFNNGVYFGEQHKGSLLSKNRLAHWVKKVIVQANQVKWCLFPIKTFNVHYRHPLDSTKRSVTSNICDVVTSSSTSTFTRFCRLSAASLPSSVMNLSGSHPHKEKCQHMEWLWCSLKYDIYEHYLRSLPFTGNVYYQIVLWTFLTTLIYTLH